MKKIVLIVFTLTLSFCVFSQKSTLKKADRKYENLSYPEAIQAYKKVSPNKLSTPDLRNLAKAYQFTEQTDSAEVYYELLSKRKDNNGEDLFQYAQTLLMNDKVDLANIWMEKFHKKQENDSRGKDYAGNKEEIKRLKKDLGRFDIFTIDANSKMHDFSPAFHKDKIVFASARESSLPAKLIWNWNNQPYLNLFEADLKLNLQFLNVKLMSKKYNKKYHDGPASFSDDGKLMVFNRNNYEEKNDSGERRLKMFYRELNEEGKWGSIKGFDFNNKDYSVGLPAVSPDGNTVYFVSDMPGGYGSTDLYKITRTNGVWSKPQNLGKNINTEGREMFPFIHQDGLLFFASDGHIGIGGLDVFMAVVDGDNYSNIQNLGYPLNSIKDDFGLILDKTQRFGYFSSNRSGGKGSDDIYGYKLLKSLDLCKEINGIASDNKGNILPQTTVKLYQNDTLIETAVTDDQANFSFCVKPGVYTIIGSKNTYFDGKNTAKPTETLNEPVVANVILEKDPGFILVAVVKDKKTLTPIENALLTFENKLDKTNTDKQTNNQGKTEEPLKGLRLGDAINYDLIVNKEGYLSKTIPFSKKLTQPGIQEVEILLEQIPNFSLYALVTDKKTGKPIEGVEVTMVNNLTNTKETIILPASGDFERAINNKELNDNISYQFILSKEGYLTKELTYNKKLTKEGRYETHVDLDFTLNPLEIGGDLSKLIEINSINFDLNKYNIRPDAAVELDKIVKIMNEYPGMYIELGAHTDCRASKAYNEALSDNRAKASADYIKSKITNPERIFGKGYGESKLLNKCACEGAVKVPCTEEEHAINRRTEFRIIKLDAEGVKVKTNGPQSFDE